MNEGAHAAEVGAYGISTANDPSSADRCKNQPLAIRNLLRVLGFPGIGKNRKRDVINSVRWMLPVTFILLTLLDHRPFSLHRSLANMPAPPASALRVRKNIEDLMRPENAAELSNLRHAFEVVMQRSQINPDDPNGYLFFADFHNDNDRGPCVHNTSVFLWWHRAHLAAFEKLLQESDPDNAATPTRDVMLPYWDWTLPPSGAKGYPKGFEEPTTSEGNPNNFVWPNPILCPRIPCAGRDEHTDGRPPYSAAAIADLLEEDWSHFGGRDPRGTGNLEAQPHNYMHGTYVGGDMGSNTTAAKDPIFWAFHTNIDRILEKWQQLHQGDQCSTSPDPSKISCFTCPLRGRGHWPPAGVVKDVICSATLGYQYADLPAETLPVAALGRAAAPRSQRIVAEAGVPISLSFKAPATVTGRVYLSLTDVSIPPDISYIARIYLHPPTEKFTRGNQQFADKYYASFFVVWANKHGDHGAGALQSDSSNFEVNITSRLKEMVRTYAGKKLVATVVFTPVQKGTSLRGLKIGKEVKYGKVAIKLPDGGTGREIILKPR